MDDAKRSAVFIPPHIAALTSADSFDGAVKLPFDSSNGHECALQLVQRQISDLSVSCSHPCHDVCARYLK